MKPESKSALRLFLLLLLALAPLAGCKGLGGHEPDARVTIQADGTTRINGERIAIPDLTAALRNRGITPTSEVEVFAHPDAPLRYVAEVLQAFGNLQFPPDRIKVQKLKE